MNASKLLVKQSSLNANVYLYFLPPSHKATTVKELKIAHKDKKEGRRQQKERFKIGGNSLNAGNCFRRGNAVIPVLFRKKAKKQLFPLKTS